MIAFEFQKNDWRHHTVHQFATGDKLLCPVKAGARIVKRVLAIPNADRNSKICLCQTEDGSISSINSAQALPRLRAVVESMGEATLGFCPEDIGLHSIRSGGAMAMFLSGMSTIIIMRIGHWSSEAFLECIREQVKNFTCGVSKKMLQFEHFHTINAKQSLAHQETDLEEIFIPDTGDGKTVSIDHQVRFSSLAL